MEVQDEEDPSNYILSWYSRLCMFKRVKPPAGPELPSALPSDGGRRARSSRA